MIKKNIRYAIYTIIIIILISVSAFYRMNFYESYYGERQLSPELKDKTIIRLWMKKSIISPTRSYQIEKFNNTNKDNIHIVFSEYKEDYYNALRTTLASGQGPDIFEYGFNALMKNDQVAYLDEINMDLSKVNKDNIVYYKDNPLGIKLIENNVKFIWNKEIFEKAGLDPNKPPQNWSELIEYSNKIKSKFPDITAFAFPFKEYEDMNIAIGQPSVNSGTIYTTFWNYKQGKYDFSYAKDILNTYKDLYSKNILEEDFDKKSKNQLRSEFYQENIAMMVSTYEDKAYFSNILPLGFEVGVSNIMQVDGKSKNKYYFTNNSNFLVLSKTSIEKAKDDTEEIIQEKTKKAEAIKKVYEYLVSNEVNNEILQTRNALPINVNNTMISNDVYSGYNDVNDFSNQRLDPTIFLSRNSRYELNLVLDSIKSKSSVEKVIEDLNKQYKKYYDFAIDKEKFDFEYYKMK